MNNSKKNLLVLLIIIMLLVGCDQEEPVSTPTEEPYLKYETAAFYVTLSTSTLPNAWTEAGWAQDETPVDVNDLRQPDCIFHPLEGTTTSLVALCDGRDIPRYGGGVSFVVFKYGEDGNFVLLYQFP